MLEIFDFYCWITLCPLLSHDVQIMLCNCESQNAEVTLHPQIFLSKYHTELSPKMCTALKVCEPWWVSWCHHNLTPFPGQSWQSRFRALFFTKKKKRQKWKLMCKPCALCHFACCLMLLVCACVNCVLLWRNMCVWFSVSGIPLCSHGVHLSPGFTNPVRWKQPPLVAAVLTPCSRGTLPSPVVGVRYYLSWPIRLCRIELIIVNLINACCLFYARKKYFKQARTVWQGARRRKLWSALKHHKQWCVKAAGFISQIVLLYTWFENSKTEL